MLRYIAKICFVALLAFQNLDTADAESELYRVSLDCDKYSSGYSDSCDGTCKQPSSNSSYSSYAEYAPKCEENYLKNVFQCPWGKTNCGSYTVCGTNWYLYQVCTGGGCWGYYRVKITDKNITNGYYQDLYYTQESFRDNKTDGGYGYPDNAKGLAYINIGLPKGDWIKDWTRTCNNGIFPAECNYDAKFYKDPDFEKDPDIEEEVYCSLGPEVRYSNYNTLTFYYSNCHGCAYCDTVSTFHVEHVNLPGYQQEMKQSFDKDDENSPCKTELQKTWQCAAGYYKLPVINKDVDPAIDPNIVCEECSIGTYAYAGSSECTQCPMGSTTYTQDDKGFNYDSAEKNSADDCKPCPKGYYEEDKLCKPCSGNTYQDEEGKAECKPCPDGFIIDNKDLQINITQCYIDPPNIQLSDSLGTINLADEIGSAPLYYVGPQNP